MRNPNPETADYAEVRRVESVLVPQSPAHRSLVAMDWDPLSPRRHKIKLVLMISLSDHGRRQSVGFPGLTPVSTRHGPPAIPIAPLHHAPKVLTLLRNPCSPWSGALRPFRVYSFNREQHDKFVQGEDLDP